MAFSGGVFSRIHNWVTDAANNINPAASRFDAEDDGFATGLSTCLLKDGTQTVTANIPMSNFKFTGLVAGTANGDSGTVGQIQSMAVAWIDGGGTADAITGTYSPAVTALVDGHLLGVRATAANTTTTPTFSPNGLTARTIVKYNGAALAVGDIVGDQHDLLLRYDLGNTRWNLLNPGNEANLAGATFTGQLILPTTGPSSTLAAGYRGAPTATQNVAYTMVLADAGTTILHDETTTRTWTIPANASVAFPVGTVIILDNTGNSGGVPGTITLAITTDTLRRGDGTAGTGSRTIGSNRVACIRKSKTTEWIITGSFS